MEARRILLLDQVDRQVARVKGVKLEELSFRNLCTLSFFHTKDVQTEGIGLSTVLLNRHLRQVTVADPHFQVAGRLRLALLLDGLNSFLGV